MIPSLHGWQLPERTVFQGFLTRIAPRFRVRRDRLRLSPNLPTLESDSHESPVHLWRAARLQAEEQFPASRSTLRPDQAEGVKVRGPCVPDV